MMPPNGHILVVDDDKVTLRALEGILCSAGYCVIPLSLGREAIRVAKEQSPALIILDIMMPDIDGGEVASLLKKDAETMNIPILFLSSLVSKREEQSSSKEHGIHFLSKPFDREVLLSTIKRCI